MAHAFLWECSHKRLNQLLGQLGVVLTWHSFRWSGAGSAGNAEAEHSTLPPAGASIQSPHFSDILIALDVQIVPYSVVSPPSLVSV